MHSENRAGRSWTRDTAPTPAGPALPANRAAHQRASTESRGADPGEADRCALRPPAASPRSGTRRLPWAELLQRVFGLDALRCPNCGARWRLVAAIEDPELARRILACLDLPVRAPPLGAAPRASIGEAHGSWDGDPAWDFDQTPPDGYGT